MFDGYIRDQAFWNPRAPAVVTPRRIVSYAQFDADIDRIGTALAALGVRAGCGVVSLRIFDPYLHRVILASLSRLAVPSSPAADEAADIKLEFPAEAQGPADGGVLRLTPAWAAGALAAPHAPLPRPLPDPDAIVRIMLSSGTTATPKRVAFTWRRLEAATLTNIRVYGAGKVGLWVPITGIDTLLGFSMGVAAWALGAAYASDLGIADLAELTEAHPQGVAVITPFQLRQFLAGLPPGYMPKPGWRLQVGGSALPASLAAEAALRVTPDIWTGYGATESSRVSAGPAASLLDVPGAVGPVVAGAVVRIVGEDGRPAPEGELGELHVRSTRTAEGYLDDPDLSAERFTDGWYRTGDVGRRLPDGRIVLEGRLDDRMIVDGMKFWPGRLEAAALACPGVVDCAAFAVPDAAGLEICWLAVAAEPGFDQGRLIAHLDAQPGLSPRRFAWIDEIPRNAMGKVERAQLRDLLIAALGQASGRDHSP